MKVSSEDTRVDAGCSTCSVGEGESTSSAIICFSYWSMFSLRYRILFLAILFSLSSLLRKYVPLFVINTPTQVAVPEVI